MSGLLGIRDIERGMLVAWDWSEDMVGLASKRGVRPVGRVVTQEDLPSMSTVEGPCNIQCLDDAAWLLSPDTMLRKGREIRAFEDSAPKPR